MEMLLLAGLAVLALFVTAAVVGSLVRVVLWILFLPFRVVGWLLFLPLLLLKVAVAIVGAILTPVVAAVLAAVVAGLFVPLIPVLVIAAFVWLVVKMSRPSHRSVPS